MSLFKSVATFGSFTILSRITGFLRDMVLARYLGAGLVSDAFFVSFQLPNLFRSLFAEGAFTSAFVPMVAGKMHDKEKVVIFSSSAVSVLAFFLAIFVLLVEIFMPYIVLIIAPGFVEDGGKIELATELSRITFPFLLFISIVSFQSGILNSLGKFAAPASAPVILNLLMIFFVFAFLPFTSNPVYGCAIGVTVAGFVEILWLNYFLRKECIYLRPRFDVFNLLKDKEIKTLFKRIAPGVLGSGIYQINMMVNTVLVSLVSTGAISWLYFANRIQQLPLGVVGAAISVALLPILSKQLKDNEIGKARHTQNRAIEIGALLSIPAAVGICILAKPITTVLFQYGKFGAFETEMTYKAVIAYTLSLPFYVAAKALTPNFFARGDTKTPVKYSIVVFAANIIFALILMKPFGHIGIAAATSIASFVSVYQYCHGLKKRNYWSFEEGLIRQILKIIICSLIMGMVVNLGEMAIISYLGDWLRFQFLIKFIILGFLCSLGLATFAIAAIITGVIDYKDILKILRIKK